jgi:hypothetical protein
MAQDETLDAVHFLAVKRASGLCYQKGYIQ